VIDVENNILAVGGEYHIDCEEILIKSGSTKKIIWFNQGIFRTMRDRKFIIDSIKMDLYRVVTAVGNLNSDIQLQSVYEFITHAINDFSKTTLTENDKKLKAQLESLKTSLSENKDPNLTIRCRLWSV